MKKSSLVKKITIVSLVVITGYLIRNYYKHGNLMGWR